MALTAYQKALRKTEVNNLIGDPNAPVKTWGGPGYTESIIPKNIDLYNAGAVGATNTGNPTAASKISSGIGKVKDVLQNKPAAFKVNPLDTQGATNNVNVTGSNLNTSSGDAIDPSTLQALGTPTPAAQKSTVPAATTPMKQYLWRNMGDPNMTTMTDKDKLKWAKAMQGYANGDYTAFNENFQKEGNWSSYVDDNGNVNGMLRYAGDGIGGYVPVNNGQLLQNGFSGDLSNYAFYGPNGEVYTVGADGKLTQTGEWTTDYDPFPKNGYYKNNVYDNEDRIFIGPDGQVYTYGTAPDEKLAEWGYVRKNGGLWYEPQTVAANSPDGTWEQNNPLYKPGGNSGGNGGGNTPSGGSSYSGSSSSVGTTPTQPMPNYQPVQTQPVQTQPTQTPYQAAIEEWSYGPAPEWNGTDYERQRDELLQNAMNPYEGSPYDQQRDDALARYGEEWQGSEYQQKRDAALRRAEEMQWDYDPNTDPVWQALQKQYRREGDRATQEAMAQAAMRTGGLANSYAVTAASQAGDYYAAQLSDRLPQLYQDAYQRYLQEFQRQMGISDQYQGFDDREYSRWADQQGKNLDLADRYNQYGQQDYNRYMDRVSQQLQGTDRYNQYGGTEYQRYMDQLGQYNTDRNFDYGRYRDRIGDARYADETAYDRQRDAISDQRYDQEWAQQLREYADSQNWKATEWQQYLREYGDKMSQADREWAYQQYRDAVGDQQYADQTAYQRALQADALAYDRQQDALDREYKQNAFQSDLREADDKRYKDGMSMWYQYGTLPERYAEIVGYPAGTRWEDVFGNMDAEEAYSSGGGGGGYSGSGGGSGSNSTPTNNTEYDETGRRTGTWKDADGYTYNGYHPDGQWKSEKYDSVAKKAKSELSGKSKTEATRWVISQVEKYAITEYEAYMILEMLGYKESSAGTGRDYIGPNNVNMVQ